jgi:alkanesulfonate monooxygenase SsuD/methylene tetrahydromethanopterin reductase-like flavin-dependent oxidoreductase (luciferase family)
MSTMQLGAHVGQQNMSADDMRALWRKLDGGGADWISAWDHIYEAPPANGTIDHFEAVATLGALAVETQNARIGCLVFYVGYRNAGLLAKVASTLDHLSGGRFTLGIGAGWHEWEAAAYGYDFPPAGRRLDMLDESAQLIRSLLTQDRTTFSGDWVSAEDASCLPAPVQERLPIWIGGIGEKRTLRMAAKHADGWNAAYISADEFGRLNGVLDKWCDVEGRDPAKIERSANLMFHLADDEAGLARERQRIDDEWGPQAERVAGGALLCTPEAAVEKILEYRAAGADMLNVALRAPVVSEALDAYLEVVMPAVKAES